MLKKNLLAGFVNADRLTLSKQELANCFDLVVSGSVLLLQPSLFIDAGIAELFSTILLFLKTNFPLTIVATIRFWKV